MREAIENAWRKIERFANLACGAAPAVCNHVRGHGRAVFAVTPINFLDHGFAAVATWKIEIYIRPAFPAFVQEPLEHQIVAHRIDRRDAEAIADRAVGRAAPALDHD